MINTPTYLRLREQIRDDIVVGVWAPGSHITLDKLGGALPGQQFIDDTYHLHGALWAMLACLCASDVQLKALEQLSRAYEDVAGAGDVAASVAANREFHHHLDRLVDAFRRVHGDGPGRQDKVIAQHRKIVRAIVRHEADAASEAVLAHIGGH